VLSGTGRWTLGISDGKQFVGAAWGTWSRALWDDIAVADVDGDGKADLVGLTQNGQWVVGLAEAGALRTSIWARTGKRISGTSLQVGHFAGAFAAAVFLPGGTWLGALAHAEHRFALRDLGQWPLGLDAQPYHGDVLPYAAGAPWDPDNSRAILTDETPALLQGMYFNSLVSYRLYVDQFYGVLRSWVHEADLNRITGNDELVAFLGRKLAAHFNQTGTTLARLYPGQTTETYRLLMAMNLAHGYFIYGPAYGSHRAFNRLLHLSMGDCSEIADLAHLLIQAEGIPVQLVEQGYSYQSAIGFIGAGHVAVYAGGLWLDAEINTAFAFTFRDLARTAPNQRLQSLLDHHRVYGFYDWYLQPQVRAEQLARGWDGGIIAFYYKYYLAGYQNGNSRVLLR
jgi:hypothetical protein